MRQQQERQQVDRAPSHPVQPLAGMLAALIPGGPGAAFAKAEAIRRHRPHAEALWSASLADHSFQYCQSRSPRYCQNNVLVRVPAVNEDDTAMFDADGNRLSILVPMECPVPEACSEARLTRKLPDALKALGCGERYERLHPERIPAPFRKAIDEYLSVWQASVGDGRMVWFCGDAGTGKTCAAAYLAAELLLLGLSVEWWGMDELVSRLNGWRPLDDQQRMLDGQELQRTRDVQVLVVDDVDKRVVNAKEFGPWFALVEHRHSNLLPMIVTSNSGPETMAGVPLWGPVVERWREECGEWGLVELRSDLAASQRRRATEGHNAAGA